MKITADISPGELIDKITILEIKSERITDSVKLSNVRNELQLLSEKLRETIETSAELDLLIKNLKKINEKLWVIEDNIRDKERVKVFDDEFIELARSVYFTNDERAKIKNEINIMLSSTIVEEKSYSSYS